MDDLSCSEAAQYASVLENESPFLLEQLPDNRTRCGRVANVKLTKTVLEEPIDEDFGNHGVPYCC